MEGYLAVYDTNVIYYFPNKKVRAQITGRNKGNSVRQELGGTEALKTVTDWLYSRCPAKEYKNATRYIELNKNGKVNPETITTLDKQLTTKHTTDEQAATKQPTKLEYNIGTNLINILPTSLSNNVETKADIPDKTSTQKYIQGFIDSNGSGCSNLDLVKSDRMELYVDKLQTAVKALEEAKAIFEEARESQSIMDCMRNDILHLMEFKNANAAEGYQLYKLMHDVLESRRDCKDISYYTNTQDIETALSTSKDILSKFEGLDRKYSARALPQLFECDNGLKNAFNAVSNN